MGTDSMRIARRTAAVLCVAAAACVVLAWGVFFASPESGPSAPHDAEAQQQELRRRPSPRLAPRAASWHGGAAAAVPEGIGIATALDDRRGRDFDVEETLPESSDRLRLPKFFSSHMMLQRAPQKARVWGWAPDRRDVGSTVRVTLSAPRKLIPERVETAVQTDGSWQVQLAPQRPGYDYTVLVELWPEEGTRPAQRLRLTDVAFGDVLLCSGQSNMEFAVAHDLQGAEYIRKSASRLGRGVRFIDMDHAEQSSPQQDAAPRTSDRAWTRARPDAFHAEADGEFSYPSAVCYFTALHLFELGQRRVPVGFISTTWGGQPIAAFSSADARRDSTCGGLDPDRVQPPRPPNFKSMEGYQAAPSGIWNGQLAPLLPFRFAAVVWYQGESDAAPGAAVPECFTYYSCAFPAFISDLRRKLGQGELPFVFVLLAGLRDWPNFVGIRAAQLRAMELERVGVASALDLGNPGDIHPRHKVEVGRRAALSIAHNARRFEPVYEGSVSGPLLRAVLLQDRRLDLEFVPDTAVGLYANGTTLCQLCCQESPFEYAITSPSGRNVTWRRARFHIGSAGQPRNVLSLDVPQSPSEAVTAVRYAQQDFTECSIYNSDGIPGLPFTWDLSTHSLPVPRKRAAAAGGIDRAWVSMS